MSAARVLVAYATLFGNTRKMAEALAEGARAVPGTEVVLKPCDEAGLDDLRAADAVVLGAAVHMGTADWRMKRFIEEVIGQLWLADELTGKLGAVFITGGGYGGGGSGAEGTALGLLTALAECGMVLLPFPKRSRGAPAGSAVWAPYGRTGGPLMEPLGIQEDALSAAREHGGNVARVAGVLAAAGRSRLLADGVAAPPREALPQIMAMMGKLDVPASGQPQAAAD